MDLYVRERTSADYTRKLSDIPLYIIERYEAGLLPIRIDGFNTLEEVHEFEKDNVSKGNPSLIGLESIRRPEEVFPEPPILDWILSNWPSEVMWVLNAEEWIKADVFQKNNILIMFGRHFNLEKKVFDYAMLNREVRLKNYKPTGGGGRPGWLSKVIKEGFEATIKNGFVPSK
jgi:hypothetical protein